MSASSKHVLAVGWDGVRADFPAGISTPWLDRITEAGFFQDVRVSDLDPTLSGPVWATTATGVHSNKHGITTNDMSASKLDDHPDFLTLVRNANAALETFAAAQWEPLVGTESGGPLFSPGGYSPRFGGPHQSLDETKELDELLSARCAVELLNGNPAATYIHLDYVDAVAHAEGVTERYWQAVEHCDQLTGVLLAAIEARPTRLKEEWTVLIVSDHGQVDKGGHGGDTDEERTAWIADMGPQLTNETVIPNGHVDVAPQVLSSLGLPLPDWFEGAPFATVPKD